MSPAPGSNPKRPPIPPTGRATFARRFASPTISPSSSASPIRFSSRSDRATRSLSLARQQGGTSARAFQSLPHPRETAPALRCALQTLGQLWTLGVEVDWAKLHAPGSAQRVPLPTYPFEHQKFWIEPDQARSLPRPLCAPAEQRRRQSTGEQATSFYRRVWSSPVVLPARAMACWLIFRDSLGLARPNRRSAQGHKTGRDPGRRRLRLQAVQKQQLHHPPRRSRRLRCSARRRSQMPVARQARFFISGR